MRWGLGLCGRLTAQPRVDQMASLRVSSPAAGHGYQRRSVRLPCVATGEATRANDECAPILPRKESIHKTLMYNKMLYALEAERGEKWHL